ncbi:prepilin peptidase [Sulfitobacter aestuariivivens]|uniref:Prepilin leader peptidase/N-methyltransferase n=1 Tax=Sulfitobacter aestuariivivens TaxID=2766981 RepID=A0A927D4C6_9RHOB|nr:A24 family peptidase [Sulfitobacter aestuariivivens]MBD3664935.1 prepilin peptidase [Sulfitobacter aestuariivivens]
MQSDLYLSLLLLLVSPAVGSFLAVMIDRLPRGESVVRPRSACRTCGALLRVGQMVPLLSFIVQRGRCASCGAEIPSWVFYVELLALGSAVLALARGGDIQIVWLHALFLWLLIALAGADLLWFRLPDVLTGCLVLTGFLIAARPGGLTLSDAALGAAVGAGSFLALRIGYRIMRGREGLGLGDVKLMAGLGAFAGLYDLPLLVLIGALIALSVAVLQRMRAADALAGQRAIPFGAALCAAAAVLWVLGLPTLNGGW